MSKSQSSVVDGGLRCWSVGLGFSSIRCSRRVLSQRDVTSMNFPQVELPACLWRYGAHVFTSTGELLSWPVHLHAAGPTATCHNVLALGLKRLAFTASSSQATDSL